MDKYQTGRNAGTLWHLSSDPKKWRYDKLKRGVRIVSL